MHRKGFCIILLLALGFLFTGCPGKNTKTDTVVIAEQFGLAYAPLQVLKTRKDLAEAPEGVKVEWVRTGNAAVIREAMAADRMDIGFMGIPPFLIGAQGGMEWKIICGLSRSPLGLVTTRKSVATLADFTSRDRIALPQPGSIQHILLAMQADRELGDPSALDSLLVTMSHPDGMNALLSGSEITAHFTSPPFLMAELSTPGCSLVLSGEEAFGGPFTFIIGVVNGSSLKTKGEFLHFLLSKLDNACRFLEEKPAEAAALLADVYDMPEEELLQLLNAEGMAYTTDVTGLEKFGGFMHRAGYLDTSPEIGALVHRP